MISSHKMKNNTCTIFYGNDHLAPNLPQIRQIYLTKVSLHHHNYIKTR